MATAAALLPCKASAPLDFDEATGPLLEVPDGDMLLPDMDETPLLVVLLPTALFYICVSINEIRPISR